MIFLEAKANIYYIIGAGIGGLVLGVIAVSMVLLIKRRKTQGEPVLRMSGLMNQNFKE